MGAREGRAAGQDHPREDGAAEGAGQDKDIRGKSRDDIRGR